VKTLDTHPSELNELRVKKSIYSISSDAVADAVKIDISKDRRVKYFICM